MTETMDAVDDSLSFSFPQLRTSKFLTNRLLNRKQMVRPLPSPTPLLSSPFIFFSDFFSFLPFPPPQVLDVFHPDLPNVSKKEITQLLAKEFNVVDEKTVVVFGFRTHFGGGRVSSIIIFPLPSSVVLLPVSGHPWLSRGSIVPPFEAQLIRCVISTPISFTPPVYWFRSDLRHHRGSVRD